MYENENQSECLRLRELDKKFVDEQKRWNKFFNTLPSNHPLSTLLPDEHLVEWAKTQKCPSGRALDLGCGNGRNSVYLAQVGFQVDANDISETALNLTKSNAESADVDIRCLLGAFFNLKLVSEYYDLIYDFGCLHHVHPHRRPQYIEFVTRNLRVGGHFILGCFNEKMGTTKSDKELLRTFDMEGGLSMSKDKVMDFFSHSFELLKFRSMRAVNDTNLGVGWDHMSISVWQKRKA